MLHHHSFKPCYSVNPGRLDLPRCDTLRNGEFVASDILAASAVITYATEDEFISARWNRPSVYNFARTESFALKHCIGQIRSAASGECAHRQYSKTRDSQMEVIYVTEEHSLLVEHARPVAGGYHTEHGQVC
jgi:hypothetical protein